MSEPYQAIVTNDDDTVTAKMGKHLMHEWNGDRALRRSLEDEWVKDVTQYVGKYDESVTIQPGASRIFIKRTRTKVRTMDARIGEIVLPVNKKLWDIAPSPLPSIPPSRTEFLLSKLIEVALSQGLDPSAITREHVAKLEMALAKTAARKMSNKVADVLAESRFHEEARRVYHSGHLYGMGIMKGPLIDFKSVRRWAQIEGGKYGVVEENVKAPFISAVKVWDFYADFTVADLRDAEHHTQTYFMSKSKFYSLCQRKDFYGKVIHQYIKDHSDGDASWDNYQLNLHTLSRVGTSNETTKPLKQYLVAERWGVFDVADFRKMGVDIPDSFSDGLVEVQISFMPADGTVIKAVINPFKKLTRPFSIYIPFPEETHPFGASLPYDMRDTQQLFNAVVRMANDNGAFTSKPQFEVMLSRLVNQKSATDMRPGKVHFLNEFAFNNGQQAINPIEVKNHLSIYMQFLANVKQWDDEAVALPSFQHGEKSGGAGRTVGGLSLLMGAANLMLKEPLRAWDEMFESLLNRLVDYHMQFDPDQSIKGDFDVQVRGTYSVLAKEYKSEKLEVFAETVSNQLDAPFVNRRELLLERAEALEINPKIVKNEEQIAEELKAQMAQMQAGQGQGENGQPTDQSGGAQGDGRVAPPQQGARPDEGAPPGASGEGGDVPPSDAGSP